MLFNSIFQSPILLLITGVVVLGGMVWLFYPEKGVLSQYHKKRNRGHRIDVEDALKYIFDCEYRQKTCVLADVSRKLNMSRDNTQTLLQELVTMALIVFDDDNRIVLTDTGRSYSLRIIRVHRIWEKYLADETGVEHLDWHTKADEMEHFVTTSEANRLASKIGNPVFDPHGDPIPSTSGEMPKHNGVSLFELEEGEQAIITHIEDEPINVFEQLTATGLYPGMYLYVSDKKAEKMTIVKDGDECVLTNFFASQITVLPSTFAVQENEKENLLPLSALALGETAEIVRISKKCVGVQRRRLLDFGFVKGTPIVPQIVSTSGNPTGYSILGTTVGIRKEQADLIYVRKKR